jgi:hemoglobin/transferrin/lactoferrin receptor protein
LPFPLSRHAAIGVAVAAFFTASAVHGETPLSATPTGVANDQQSLQEITVTAVRRTQRVNDTAKPITLIDRQQIEALNPATIFDVLQTVPGLEIARAGGIEGQINLRGFNSNYYHSPLFIDGDRFKGRNTLEYQLLEPEDMERIEVIRGPAAEAFGSEAVGGVVNLTTFHPTPIDGPFRITGGGSTFSYATVNNAFGVHGDVEGGGDGFGFRLAANARHAGSYDTPAGVAHNSDYKDAGGSMNLAYALSDSEKLELSGRIEGVTAGRAGGIGGAPGYPIVTQRDDTLQARLGRLAYSGDFSGPITHIDADVFVDDFYGKIPSANRGNPAKTTYSTSYVVGPTMVGGNLIGTVPWSQGSSTVGLDFFDEMRPEGSQGFSQVVNFGTAGQVTSIVTTPRHQTTPGDSQANIGFFVDNVWNPTSQWTITASGRFDWFDTATGTSPVAAIALQPLYAQNASVNKEAETGSLGAIFHASPIADLVLTYGNFFREPSDTELFSASVQGAGYSLPNPALKPERGTALEGGFRLHFADGFNLDFTAFYDQYRDFVETVPVLYDGLPSTQAQNVQRAEAEGVEAEGKWQVDPAVSVFGTLTYTRATDLGKGIPLAYIPPLHGRLNVGYAPLNAGYVLTASMDWAMAKTRIDPTQEYPTSGYAIFDLSAQLFLDRLVSPRLGETRLIVSVDNLADSGYRSAATYANVAYAESMTNPLLEPGRNFTFTLRHRF